MSQTSEELDIKRWPAMRYQEQTRKLKVAEELHLPSLQVTAEIAELDNKV